ncbi:PAS domain-containing protein [Alkalicoccus daliensis]|uniref:PAS domain S-box-containing protein n=1 Tax=Alkalicoccus daliensis TaxID=745820 RepID=A0A1H0IPJ8_9BACI|nr:STAS domain-containing protein [Alkalicoccus daliensis]SDO33308.1 PAS domain S-box-containing protein [Alkalicoccus daliensis]
MAEDLQALKNKVLEKTQLVFIICDPSKPDNPIIYANQGFSRLTGYENEEIIGKNCRFLQGEDTDPETVETIRKAIKNKEPVSVELLNYRKDGTSFWNLLHIDPIYLEDEEQFYFVGIQKDITAYKKAEQKLEEYNNEIDLLSTPIVPVKSDVSVLPLIGNIDERRMNVIVERILPELNNTSVDTLIVDLSGFQDIDETATGSIFRLADLLKLKGIEMILTGITPKIAIRASGLDIDLSALKTYGSVKQALDTLDSVKES